MAPSGDRARGFRATGATSVLRIDRITLTNGDATASPGQFGGAMIITQTSITDNRASFNGGRPET